MRHSEKLPKTKDQVLGATEVAAEDVAIEWKIVAVYAAPGAVVNSNDQLFVERLGVRRSFRAKNNAATAC
jgi:hypothetical protein